MKKFLKFLLIGGIIVGLLLAIGVTLVGTSIDRIVEAVVEDQGTKVTGTEVRLDDVAISLREGRGSLYGLSIANPATFTPGSAFALGEITVDLDVSSIRSEEIVIERMVVDGAQINLEEVDGKTNLQELQRHLRQYAGDSSETTDETDTPRLVIQEFRFTNAKATMSTSRLANEVTVSVPDIILHDIGKKGAGVTAAEAGQQILRPLLSKILEGSQRDLLDTLKANALDRLDNLLQRRAGDEGDPVAPEPE